MTARKMLLQIGQTLSCVAMLSACGGDSSGTASERSLYAMLDAFYAANESGYESDAVAQEVSRLTSDLVALRPRSLKSIGDYLFGNAATYVYQPNHAGIVINPMLVLTTKKGNCLGLATLLLIVAEQLGVRAHAVLQPHPLHVIVTDGRDYYDPTEHFTPVPQERVRGWRRVGPRYGTRLSSEQLLALHIEAIASLSLLHGVEEGHSAWGLYRRALELDASSSLAHQGLALEAFVLGDIVRSELLAAKAVQLNPKSKKAQHLLDLLRSKRDPTRASYPTVPNGGVSLDVLPVPLDVGCPRKRRKRR